MNGMIPNDLDGFCFLEDLKLCGNKFKSVPLLPSSVHSLDAEYCLSLESINLRNFPGNGRLHLQGSINVTNIEGYFNSEPLEIDFAEKLLGSSPSDWIRNSSIRKIDYLAKADKKCPLQAVSEMGMYSIFLPGCQIPTWFRHQNEGDFVSLNVPRVDTGSSITGVVTCGVYAWKESLDGFLCSPHITITNRTKMFEWIYDPCVLYFSSDFEQI